MAGDEETSSSSSRKGKARALPDDQPTFSSERTPLLSGSASSSRYDGEYKSPSGGDEDDEDEDDSHIIAGPSRTGASSQRTASRASSVRSAKAPAVVGWPSLIAGITLMVLVVTIMLGAFFVPAAVEEYAKQAAVLEPTNLSLESITADGVRARIQASFRLDGSRVRGDGPRRIGRVATWFVRKLGTDETRVRVYLPQFENVLLGTAVVPPLTIDVVDGHSTTIDLVTNLVLGDAEGIRSVANTWLEGRLDKIKLVGKADVSVKAGAIPLGTHSVVESIVVEGQSLYRSFASLYFGEKVFI